jgi:hypothetical protein
MRKYNSQSIVDQYDLFCVKFNYTHFIETIFDLVFFLVYTQFYPLFFGFVASERHWLKQSGVSVLSSFIPK